MSFTLKINQYPTKSTVCVFFFLIPVSLVLFKLGFCIPVCMTKQTRVIVTSKITDHHNKYNSNEYIKNIARTHQTGCRDRE